MGATQKSSFEEGSHVKTSKVGQLGEMETHTHTALKIVFEPVDLALQFNKPTDFLFKVKSLSSLLATKSPDKCT